jgi:hypothetical protein
MSIVVKELFSSDPISDAIEKINFNFDQIILGGGGPPGLPGPAGPPGPVGTIGPRGDHWFTGITYGGVTTDHDGVNSLRVQDNFLDINGNVWNYFDDGLGNTGWTFSGINLKGPTGDQGAGGGSDDLRIHLGLSGNQIQAANLNYGPEFTPSPTDNEGLNFLSIRGATKNTLLLGDPEWFNTKVLNWNNVQQSAGNQFPFVESTPRLTVIQRQVDYFGVNGIQIGAYGLTSGTGPIASPFATLVPLPTGVTVDSTNFFNLGLSLNQTYNREIVPNNISYWGHVASIKTLKKDIAIEAGDVQVGSIVEPIPAAIRMKSSNFTTQDWEDRRWISSGILTNSSITSTRDHVIQINAINTDTSISSSSIQSYIHLQGASGIAGTDNGPVIIGPFNPVYKINRRLVTSIPQASLIISRPVSSINGNPHASIAFHDPDSSNAVRYTGSITAFWNNSLNESIRRNLIIKTGSLSIVRDNSLNLSTDNYGRFPLHINQGTVTGSGDSNILGTGWAAGSTGWLSDVISTGGTFSGWLAGFDKWDYYPGGTSTRSSRGLGIGYVSNSTITAGNGLPPGISTSNSKEIILQSYFIDNFSPTGGLSTSGITSMNIDAIDRSGVQQIELWVPRNNDIAIPNPAIFSYPRVARFATGSANARTSPHLYTQLGPERSSGSFAIGFTPQGSIINPWAKLSVQGSVRIGSTSVFNIDYDNDIAKNGLLVEGRIVTGATSGSRVLTFSSREFTESFRGQGIFSTALLGDWQMLTHFSPQSVTIGRNLSTQFIAGVRGKTGSSSLTGYALADAFTGMMQGGTPGDGYLVALNVRKDQQLNEGTIRNGTISPTGATTASTIPGVGQDAWVIWGNAQPSRTAAITPLGLTAGAQTVAALKWGSRSDLRELNPNWTARTASTPSYENTTLPVVKTMGVRADSIKYVTTQDLMLNAYEVKGRSNYTSSGGSPASIQNSWLKWKYILHPIPTDASTVFFDLSAPSTYIKHYEGATAPEYNRSLGEDFASPSSQVLYWLSSPAYAFESTVSGSYFGIDTTPGFFFKEWWLKRRFVLDPGIHDGQKVTLIFGNVDVKNEFPIFESLLPTSDAEAATLHDWPNTPTYQNTDYQIQAFAPKRCILSQCPMTDFISMNKLNAGASAGVNRDYFWTNGGFNNIRSSHYPLQTEPHWTGAPWPYPIGSSSYGSTASPDTLGNDLLSWLPDTATFMIDPNISPPAYFSAGTTTETSFSAIYQKLFAGRTVSGAIGVNNPYGGYNQYLYWALGGGFIAKSWRSITLQWVRVRSTSYSNDNTFNTYNQDPFYGVQSDLSRAYAWVEIGREYLSTQFNSSIQPDAAAVGALGSRADYHYHAHSVPFLNSVRDGATTLFLSPRVAVTGSSNLSTFNLGRGTGRGIPIPQFYNLITNQ